MSIRNRPTHAVRAKRGGGYTCMHIYVIQVAKQSRTVPANNFGAEGRVRSKTLLPPPPPPPPPQKKLKETPTTHNNTNLIVATVTSV